jgi:hypothetical protein
MFYTIYKITNLINNKYYIGKHQTKNLDDGYMGSGKVLKYAIQKYGIENFKKEILHIFDNEVEMNAKEKELVVVSESTYNLNEGGKGGFSYINRNNLKLPLSENSKQKISNTLREHWQNGVYEKTKQHLIERNRTIKKSTNFSIDKSTHKKAVEQAQSPNAVIKRTQTYLEINHQQGSKNSQFNTCWINNGLQNKKINKDQLEDYIKQNWIKGRVGVIAPYIKGMIWVTNGIKSKMVKPNLIPDGWYKGRTI